MNYYVYNPKGSKPKIVHTSYESAVKEACRIAEREMDNVFVLEIKAMVHPTYKIVVEKWNEENKF